MRRTITLSSTIFLFAAGLSMAAACANDPLILGGAGGGGGSVDDDGSGGEGGNTTSSMGGEAGMGGDGGDGGDGGAGGEGGAGDDWPTQCLSGCSQMNTCLNADYCSLLFATDCDAANPPPAQPGQCIIECVADFHASEPAQTCSSLNQWIGPTTKPMAANAFIQCLAGCPGPVNQTAPAGGVLGCADQFCKTELDGCAGDDDCSDWFEQCVVECADPATVESRGGMSACWSVCSATKAVGNVQKTAYNSCLCNVQTSHANQGDAEAAWGGTGDCSDILYGYMDACNL